MGANNAVAELQPEWFSDKISKIAYFVSLISESNRHNCLCLFIIFIQNISIFYRQHY